MAHFAWILFLICVALLLLSASAAPPQTLVSVRSGSNVSLSCNLSSSEYQTWFRLDSDRILPLFSVRAKKLHGGVIREEHNQTHRIFGSKGDLEIGVSLELMAVTQDDSGVYVCSSKDQGKLRFNRAVQLAVTDPGDSPLPVHTESCWSPGLCLIPAAISGTLLLFTTICFCFCKGKSRRCCCCCCSNVTEDVPLHYSSLMHLHKPHPFGPDDVRLVRDNVVYAAVMQHKNVRSE